MKEEIEHNSIEDLQGEIWEDIPGFEGRYMISNYSRVKSILCRNHKIIKKTLSNGRMKVFIYNKYGIGKNIECGRIAASIFIRTPEENEVLKRIDGNYLNDRVSNLKWVTKKESAQEAFISGRFPKDHGKASRNGMAILTPADVKEIRRKNKAGQTLTKISKEHNTSIMNIHSIVHYKTWKNI